MSTIRGIPEPRKGDPGSVHHTLSALREAVETIQGVRTRTLQSANPDRALAEQRRRTASGAAATTLTSLEARISSLETQVADHEARIIALEAFHP